MFAFILVTFLVTDLNRDTCDCRSMFVIIIFLQKIGENLGIPFKARDSNPSIETLLWLHDCLSIVSQFFFHSSCWSGQSYIQNHWCITSFRLVFIIHSFISYPYLEYFLGLGDHNLGTGLASKDSSLVLRQPATWESFHCFSRIARFHISL